MNKLPTTLFEELYEDFVGMRLKIELQMSWTLSYLADYLM